MLIAPQKPNDDEPPKFAAVRMLAPLVVLLILTVLYDQFKHDLRGGLGHAGGVYADWVGNFINSPDNEAARGELIKHMVGVYRETPVGKSLPLRDEQGRVIGRFRIGGVNVHQPAPDSADPQQRRRFNVKMRGDGELWHNVGGRVRFAGGADVDYQIDFRVVGREFKIYSYFDCTDVRDTSFEITHVDNLLGRIFSGFVNEAGARAIVEGIRPGFTVITHGDGKSYLAQGRAARDFAPKTGPYTEDPNWETVCNDVRLLRRDYRDYLGPFQVAPGSELRIDLSVAGEGGRNAPGVDLLLLRPEAFTRYDERYLGGTPGNMAGLEIAAEQARWSTREMAYAGKPEPGVYYLLIDRTAFGLGDQGSQLNDVSAEVKFYVRMKR